MTRCDTIAESERQIPIVRRAHLVVGGGGPAGIAAAVAGARSGLSVTLLERYAYLGGLASGGMVLVLDDMCNAPRSRCAASAARWSSAWSAWISAGAARSSAAPTEPCGANGRGGRA